VRKAPTLPIEIPTQRAAIASSPSAPTVAVPAAPAASAAPRESRRVLYAAVAAAVLILAGAVVLKSKLTSSAAPAASPAAAPVAAGAQPAAETPAAVPGAATQRGEALNGAAASRGAQSPITPSPLAGSGGTTSGVPLPNATLQARGAEQPVAAPAAPAAAPPEPARAAPTEPAPVLADARAVARALVTLMNQRRARDLERLADAGGGDPAARRTLEKLVRDGDDFAAGFDRMASEPEAEGAVFVTEFVVEASWRSAGKDQGALFDVRLRLQRQGDSWVPVAYSVKAR